MACFVVPAAEAVVVTAAYFVAKKKERDSVKSVEAVTLSGEKSVVLTEPADTAKSKSGITWSKRFGWLLSLLWGGVALLAFEHFWHGEIVPYPPFLTAMANPEDTIQMLKEMSTVGVSMALTVTAVWGIFCVFVEAKARKIKAALVKSGK